MSHGVRRYLGDSYWAPDYEARLSAADRTRDFSDDLAARDVSSIRSCPLTSGVVIRRVAQPPIESARSFISIAPSRRSPATGVAPSSIAVDRASTWPIRMSRCSGRRPIPWWRSTFFALRSLPMAVDARGRPDSTPRVFRPARQDWIVRIVLALLVFCFSHWTVAGCAPRVADAGFWFEDVAYQSPGLGSLTSVDLETIEAIARAELTEAFSGMRFVLSHRRDATYKVRVVQRLLDKRFRRHVEVAGESLAISGLGGQGAVSLSYLASSALAYAPTNATRAEMIEAIGRGVGRAAYTSSHINSCPEYRFTAQTFAATSTHRPLDPSSTSATCTGISRFRCCSSELEVKACSTPCRWQPWFTLFESTRSRTSVVFA